MINYNNKEINKVPELKIGDGKLLSRFKLNIKFEDIKNWFVGLTIRF